MSLLKLLKRAVSGVALVVDAIRIPGATQGQVLAHNGTEFVPTSGVPPLPNAVPLKALSSVDEEKVLLELDASDVVRVGNETCDLAISAATELVLGLDGATPSAPTVRGGSATGTDTQAADLGLSPGVSTGNATPAVIELFVTVPGASGSSPQTQQSGVVVSEPGNDEVALLVRLKRGSTPALERVLVGAADSAGTGFRALCVPN